MPGQVELGPSPTSPPRYSARHPPDACKSGGTASGGDILTGRGRRALFLDAAGLYGVQRTYGERGLPYTHRPRRRRLPLSSRAVPADGNGGVWGWRFSNSRRGSPECAEADPGHRLLIASRYGKISGPTPLPIQICPARRLQNPWDGVGLRLGRLQRAFDVLVSVYRLNRPSPAGTHGF